MQFNGKLKWRLIFNQRIECYVIFICEIQLLWKVAISTQIFDHDQVRFSITNIISHCSFEIRSVGCSRNVHAVAETEAPNLVTSPVAPTTTRVLGGWTAEELLTSPNTSCTHKQSRSDPMAWPQGPTSSPSQLSTTWWTRWENFHMNLHSLFLIQWWIYSLNPPWQRKSVLKTSR